MKKSFLLLPLVAAFALTACTSNNSAEVTESSSDTLPNGGTWQPADIQPAAMPSGMNQPVSMPSKMNQPTYQPSYTPARVTATVAPSVVASRPNQNTTNTANYNNNSTQDSIGNCQIVRDSAGSPIYSQMSKGCYTKSSFTVGAQDTLFFISFLAGKSAEEVAALNGISTTTKLKVGQTLRLR